MSTPKRTLQPYVNNLLLYSACWEGAGTKLEDVSGEHNDGVLQFNAGWSAAGRIGNALDFPGTDQKVGIARKDYMDDPPFTVECWFRLDVLPSTRAETASLVELDAGSAQGACWNLLVDTTDKIRFAVCDAAGTTAKAIYADAPCVINTWYHALATYDAGLNMTLYVDAVAQVATDTMPDTYAADMDLLYGTNDPVNGTERRLAGRLDEVRFYSRVLSLSEIFEQWYRGLRQ